MLLNSIILKFSALAVVLVHMKARETRESGLAALYAAWHPSDRVRPPQVSSELLALTTFELHVADHTAELKAQTTSSCKSSIGVDNE